MMVVSKGYNAAGFFMWHMLQTKTLTQALELKIELKS